MIPFWGGSQPSPKCDLSAHVPMHVARWRRDLRIHVDLPVSLACDIDPAEVTAVILGVGAPQEQLATWLSSGISEKQNQTCEHQGQGGNNPFRMPPAYMPGCLVVKHR